MVKGRRSCGSRKEKAISDVLWLCSIACWGGEPGLWASINKKSLMPQLTRLKHSSVDERHFLSPTNYRDTLKRSQLTFNWEMSFDSFFNLCGSEMCKGDGAGNLET